MRKKINYEKVTFLGGFGGEPPKKKEIRSLQLLCPNYSTSPLGTVGPDLGGRRRADKVSKLHPPRQASRSAPAKYRRATTSPPKNCVVRRPQNNSAHQNL